MCLAGPQLMMLSTMTTIAGSMASGTSASRSFKTGAIREVKQMQKDKELADIQAQTAIGQTLINFREATASSLVSTAMMGRSATDASSLALLEKNWDTVQKDISAMKLQHKVNQDKRNLMMETTLDTAGQKATYAKRSALLNAVSAGTTGIMKIQDIS